MFICCRFYCIVIVFVELCVCGTSVFGRAWFFNIRYCVARGGLSPVCALAGTLFLKLVAWIG